MKRLSLVVLLSVLFVQGCAQGPIKSDEDRERAVQIYTDLGLGYLKQGNLELALDKLQRALEIDDKRVEAHHYIAAVYSQLEEPELAEKHYVKAIDLSPEDPQLLNNYGAYLCERSRFVDAEKYFLQAANAKRYRSPELAYENIALCATRSNQPETAEQYFRKALGLNENMPKSLFQMAVLYSDKEDYLRARAFLQRYHALASKTEQSLKLGIKIEQKLGNESARQEYVQSLKTLFPHVDIE